MTRVCQLLVSWQPCSHLDLPLYAHNTLTDLQSRLDLRWKRVTIKDSARVKDEVRVGVKNKQRQGSITHAEVCPGNSWRTERRTCTYTDDQVLP